MTLISRPSPANLDAEEGFLACCILDESGDVTARAIEVGITPASFAGPQNSAIFGALSRLAGPIDELLLCQQLQTEGQLDFVGGHAEVNRIANRVESTALARTYMEMVREAHTSRRISQAAAAIVEAVQSGQTALEIAVKAEALADIGATAEQGERRQTRSETKLLAKAEALQFDRTKPPEEAPWLLKLCDTEILHPGNILSVIAPQKSGKSTTQSAIIASLFGLEGSDFLSFQGRIPEGKKMIHFDTEQSAMDHYSMMLRTLKRAKWTDFPAWFSSLHVRRFSSVDRRKIMLSAARKAHKESGLALIMVDGLVDLLQDFNDVREATGLVNDLMEICEETGCAVVSTLHVNPGSQKGKESDKGRGHLGTMLEQKSETILLLKKDMVQGVDHITLATKDARHGGIKTPPVFRWCDQAKMHVSVALGEGFEALPSLAQRKADELSTLARDIFDGWDGGLMPFSMVRERIMAVDYCSERTAARKINDLLRAASIVKKDSGHYALNASGMN